MSAGNPFREIAALGYRNLIPIIPPGAPLHPKSSPAKALAKGRDVRGKAPGICRGGAWSGVDWLRLEATPAAMDVWAESGAGVGLRLGEGIVAVDFDITDPVLAARIVRQFGEIVPHRHHLRYGRKPKCLILVRVTADVPYTCVQFANGQRVELLPAGRQCVVNGIHGVTLQPYAWVERFPRVDELAIVDAATLQRFFAALAAMPEALGPVEQERTALADRTRDQALLRGSLETIRAAVAALPNTTAHFPTRDDYIRVGIAIKAALWDHPDEALALFEDWCFRWEDPPEGAGEPTPAEDWERMHPPFSVGAGWLLSMAARFGFERDPAEFLAPVAGEPATLFDAAPTETAALQVIELVPFHVAAGQALAIRQTPLVKGLLDVGALSVFYGPSNVGKTFVVLDIAFHVALGRPWGGRRVSPASVVYIAAEGAVGARKRAAAMQQAYGIEPDREIPFHFIFVPVDLLHADAPIGTAALLRAIDAIPNVGLVVVDTASRAMAGGDENSSTDMGGLVRNVDRIRAAVSAHVLLIHHTGKDIAKGARGHSLLRAATDTEVEISEGQIEVTKQREIETDLTLGFALDTVRLGKDVDGEWITSCTVRLLSTPAGRVERDPTPAEQAMIDAVRAVCVATPGGDGLARFDAIFDLLAAKSPHLKRESVRKTLSRAVEGGFLDAPKRNCFQVRESVTLAPIDDDDVFA